MSFRQSNATVAVVIAASLLASASVIAKPFPPTEGCRPVSKIEYNALVCTSEQDRSVDGIIGTVRLGQSAQK